MSDKHKPELNDNEFEPSDLLKEASWAHMQPDNKVFAKPAGENRSLFKDTEESNM